MEVVFRPVYGQVKGSSLLTFIGQQWQNIKKIFARRLPDLFNCVQEPIEIKYEVEIRDVNHPIAFWPEPEEEKYFGQCADVKGKWPGRERRDASG